MDYIKTYSIYHSRVFSFEVKLAKLYLLLLPVRMITPFQFFENILGPLTTYIDFLISLLGLILWLQHSRGFDIGSHNRPLFNQFRNTIIFLNFSSLFMALIMFLIYGDCNGVSPFKGILAMEVFYFHYIFMLLYNIRIFIILPYEELIDVCKKSCRILLMLAYIQIAVMNGVGVAAYDTVVSIIGGINTSSMLSKLCLTTSEGAAAGSIMSIYILPFLFARNLNGDKSALYEVFLWLIPLYFTHSSTAFILVSLNIVVYTYLMLKRTEKKRAHFRKLVFIIVILLLGLLTFSSLGLLGGDVWEEINYLLFEKAVDSGNGSTISRSIPLIIDWGAFTEMPILGVGNGLQGYFFNDYFPKWTLFVEGSDVGYFYDIAQTGIANGGVFWGGYLSGYGIVGLILALIYIRELLRTRKKRAIAMGVFNDVFLIAVPAFFIAGLQGELYATFYAWFIVALPFMNYNFKD